MPRLPAFLDKPAYSPIGIDIGGRNIKAVQLVASPSRAMHARAASATTNAIGRSADATIHASTSLMRTSPGDDLSPGEMLRLLGVLRRQGFVGNRAVACVPASRTLSAVIELPSRAAGVPLEAIARQELARACKRDASALELAFWELPGNGSSGPVNRAAQGSSAIAIGCAHADADAVLACLEPTGLDVLALDAAPVAYARACAQMLAGAPNLTAILGLGYNAAQILILSGPVIVYERTLADAGLRLVASGIANQLSADGATAEVADYVLRTFGCLPAERAGEAGDDADHFDHVADARALVAAHADALAGELRASMTYAARRFDAPLTRVLLAGSGADIPGLSERIADRSGCECRTARADALCPASADVDPAMLGPGAALALGLALHSMRGQSVLPVQGAAA